MSKEMKNWMDSMSELEALIIDLDLEFVSVGMEGQKN